MTEQQAQPPATEQATGTECPVCKNLTLGAHCKDTPCGWAKCKTKTCDAVINFKRGLGHCIDQSTEPGHPRRHWQTKAVLRMRLILLGGEWVDRDDH